MNKKQLVAKLAGSLNQSKADAERTFDTITNTILDALKNDDSVKIAGFGTYKVAKRSFYLLKHLKKYLTSKTHLTAFIRNSKILNKGCFYMQKLHTYF